MNRKIKGACKRLVFSGMTLLDAVCPPLSTAAVRHFYRSRALNDLRIPQSCRYEPLGTYATMYAAPPAHYRKFLGTYTLDEQSLPYEEVDGVRCIQPVALSQYGLMEYGYFRSTRDKLHQTHCLAAADKLLETQDSLGGWRYRETFRHPSVACTLRDGWYSAMAQGQAVSLLARAYSLCGKAAYRQAAHRALAPLERPVSEGGLLAELGGMPFYEEYPTAPPTYTLNGFMFCLLGLYDGWAVFEDAAAETLFRRGLDTLNKVLPLYDGTVSCYDLSHLTAAPRKRDVSRKYHIIHVELLQALNSVARSGTFDFYIQKWGKNWR